MYIYFEFQPFGYKEKEGKYKSNCLRDRNYQLNQCLKSIRDLKLKGLKFM